MQPTTPLTTPVVKVPWARKADLPRALIERAYETCKRGDEGHCINTNLVRAFATHLGRTIRHPHTYKGNFHWSEKINGQWCMFVAPLAPKYARRIDAFDHDGKHFWPPVKCPMGPVHFVGFCEPRKVDPATIKERRDRHEARIAAGKLVPGSRFRERQLPYVEIGT